MKERSCERPQYRFEGFNKKTASKYLSFLPDTANLPRD
jgi:hypothetical protein